MGLQRNRQKQGPLPDKLAVRQKFRRRGIQAATSPATYNKLENLNGIEPVRRFGISHGFYILCPKCCRPSAVGHSRDFYFHQMEALYTLSPQSLHKPLD